MPKHNRDLIKTKTIIIVVIITTNSTITQWLSKEEEYIFKHFLKGRDY